MIITAVNIFVRMKERYPKKEIHWASELNHDQFIIMRRMKKGIIRGKMIGGKVQILKRRSMRAV